jgi:hypothetical protein
MISSDIEMMNSLTDTHKVKKRESMENYMIFTRYAKRNTCLQNNLDTKYHDYTCTRGALFFSTIMLLSYSHNC